jgi:S-adenosylmethionine:tRNA ribosyltransferase-isomerase
MIFDTTKSLSLSDFDYEIPEELIAQYPAEKRENSRLLVMNRRTGSLEHSHFSNIGEFLRDDDVLVVNKTKVFPSRVFAIKEKTDHEIEIFLLRSLGNNLWESLVKPARKVRVGNRLIFSNGISAEVIDNTVSGGRVLEFDLKKGESLYPILDEIGTWPLPPYIKRESTKIDQERYQTVYAETVGAVAAPTAGLHFTNEILTQLKTRGIDVHSVLLHVGIGTFQPVRVEDVSKHRMASEFYEVTEETVDAIKKAKAKKRRIIAVGTTSVRALESAFQPPRGLIAGSGWTDKYIHPPYEFNVIDGLITNFHQPKSTLLMLVSAFSNRENIIRTYKTAIAEKYHFFSYGDAMFLQ